MSEEPPSVLRTSPSLSMHSPDNNRVHKTSTTAPQLSNGGVQLNPRSCVTCRRRKVKCDKKPVCTHCIKAHIDCIYPSPGRAPRKPRKPQDSELIDRLRKLEGVVQLLGSQVKTEDEQSSGKEGDAREGGELTHEEKIANAYKELRELKKQQREKEGEKPPGSTGIEGRFGRLVVDEGRSRYINPSFWASLSNEVEDIKGILNDSDSEEEYPSPSTQNSNSSGGVNQGFIFGLRSQSVDMLSLHPPPTSVPAYWNLYKENVDPLVKIIHCPSMEPTILEAKDCLGTIHRGLEALLFAVYYGAVTSLWPEECRELFGEEKHDLLARYRFGVEQALARADFLETDEIIVVQAIVIFLICLRRNGDARIIWTLTGLVVRMAQTLGLHRDGSHFDLSPFQIEMRRRLWWQICILDSRASEDHGADPTIVDQSFDTKMPLNVNDVALDPTMTDFPEPITGCTEMTFGLIRFEISATLRRLQYIPPGPRKCTKFFTEMGLEMKEKWIKECHERLEDKYLKDCDMSVPLYWVVATVSRLIMSKMWLMAYHPFQRLDGGSSLKPEIKDKLFKTSLENIEYSLLLESESRTRKWGWLFRTYVQWHAIAFLLTELCVRTEGEQVERAWKAIDFIVGRRWVDDQNITHKMKGHLWKPLRKLMDKAKVERDKALVAKQHQSQLVGTDTVPIMNLDFSPERLFPAETMTDEHDTNWADPRMNSNLFVTPNSTLSPNANILPTSIDETMASTIPLDPSTSTRPTNEQLREVYSIPGPFGMGNSWNMDADLTTTTIGEVSPLNGTATLQNSPLLADGTVDWANWDDMVQQFGMDVDQQQPNDQNQTYPAFTGFNQWY